MTTFGKGGGGKDGDNVQEITKKKGKINNRYKICNMLMVTME